jgi:hypothetical protein
VRVLLITPPLVQPNTPYPATTVLTGFLQSRGIRVDQVDLSLELLLRLFSREGLHTVRLETVLKNAAHYIATIDPVIRFLQGRNPALARRIVSRKFLPEGPRFRVLDVLGYEALDLQDQAKYLASLFVDDVADVIRDSIDSRFELARYAEKLAVSAPTFDPIRRDLERKNPTRIDRLLDELTLETIRKHRPDIVGLTVPFPGNVYAAFRIARRIKKCSPKTKIVLGGGYVNTELRELSDPRVFDYVDFVCLDDGAMPILSILKYSGRFLRTFIRENGRVVFRTSKERDMPHGRIGAPSFRGLKLNRYLSMLEMPNPMHRLWSDGRWNKLMLAHGCYWRKCAFCDTSLDTIRRFESSQTDELVDRIETVIRETGGREFHFTDEAAPPGLLRMLSKRLIERKTKIEWWCNVRFEKGFTPELIRLMARSGCIAVAGGLETVSNRLLRLMRKGVTVEEAARVTKAFTGAGILVHAYLMYDFPTQTAQETIDALEQVRHLFAAGCIQSAYWHRFALTVHSPMARNPKRYGIRLLPMRRSTFARNEIRFEETVAATSGRRRGFGMATPDRRSAVRDRRYNFGPGLRKAVYNYMHGEGLYEDVRKWFDFRVPRT